MKRIGYVLLIPASLSPQVRSFGAKLVPREDYRDPSAGALLFLLFGGFLDVRFSSSTEGGLMNGLQPTLGYQHGPTPKFPLRSTTKKGCSFLFNHWAFEKQAAPANPKGSITVFRLGISIRLKRLHRWGTEAPRTAYPSPLACISNQGLRAEFAARNKT